MGFDLLGKIVDPRNQLIHALDLGYNSHWRFVGGYVNEHSVDTQAVADLGNASPDREVCIQFFPEGVNISQDKFFPANLLQGGQYGIRTDDRYLLADGEARGEHNPDSPLNIIDIFHAID